MKKLTEEQIEKILEVFSAYDIMLVDTQSLGNIDLSGCEVSEDYAMYKLREVE